MRMYACMNEKPHFRLLEKRGHVLFSSQVSVSLERLLTRDNTDKKNSLELEIKTWIREKETS